MLVEIAAGLFIAIVVAIILFYIAMAILSFMIGIFNAFEERPAEWLCMMAVASLFLFLYMTQ
jgi:hypothetical protein